MSSISLLLLNFLVLKATSRSLPLHSGSCSKIEIFRLPRRRRAQTLVLTPYRLDGIKLTRRYGRLPMTLQTLHGSKAKLLDAALHVVRAKGYAAATVDDICREAGLTKGSFFHHFKSKDDLALDAAAYWGTTTEALFAAAPYRQSKDPLDRLLGYVDFRAELLTGELSDYTCLLGTLVQETYPTHPDIPAPSAHT